MARISIPIDALTSRFNLGERFSGVTSTSITQRFANLKPLSEFFDFRRISKPENVGAAQRRLNYNLGYFSSNYAAIIVLLSIYALINNTFLLFFIFFVAGGMWGIGKLQGQELVVGNWRASPSQLYTILAIASFFMFLASGFWGTFFWLVGASAATIVVHAVFMDKPIESAFSEEAV